MWDPSNDLPVALTFTSKALRVLSLLSIVGAALSLAAVPFAWERWPFLLAAALSGVINWLALRAIAVTSDAALLAARFARENDSRLARVRDDVRAIRESSKANERAA